MRIRVATKDDFDAVKQLNMRAFDKSEREIVSKLATDLLLEDTTPDTFSLIAESEDVIGHIGFSPVGLTDGGNVRAYILAPLSVSPTHQRQGIGTKLIRAGIDRLSDSGVNILIVYGDPEYYGQFGFNAETAAHFIPPYKLQYEFGWLALKLSDVDIFSNNIKLTCVESLSHSDLW